MYFSVSDVYFMKLRWLFLLLILSSCKEFNLQKIDETTLVEEELKSEKKEVDGRESEER